MLAQKHSSFSVRSPHPFLLSFSFGYLCFYLHFTCANSLNLSLMAPLSRAFVFLALAVASVSAGPIARRDGQHQQKAVNPALQHREAMMAVPHHWNLGEFALT